MKSKRSEAEWTNTAHETSIIAACMFVFGLAVAVFSFDSAPRMIFAVGFMISAGLFFVEGAIMKLIDTIMDGKP